MIPMLFLSADEKKKGRIDKKNESKHTKIKKKIKTEESFLSMRKEKMG